MIELMVSRQLYLFAVALCVVSVAALAEEGTTVSPSHSMHGGMHREALDSRKPLPLTAMMAAHQKRNMRDHLVAVQQIVTALAAGDLAAVEKAARRIGYSDAMAQMCNHMGAAPPGFGELAVTFHHAADTIAEAAGRGDSHAATKSLAATLSTCVACHAAYRQQVVDEATWGELSAGSGG